MTSEKYAESSRLRGYAFAVSLTLLIFFIRLGLEPFLHQALPLQLFLVAVVASAWFGGVGPALLSAVTGGLLGFYFFFIPKRTFVATFPEWIDLLFFCVESAAVIFLMLSFRKAADRARARAAAFENSEREFRSMFELSAVGQAQIDAETGRFLKVNPGLCQLAGADERALMGMRLEQLLHLDDRSGAQHALREAVRGESRECRFEARFVRQDQTLMWVQVHAAVIHDARGRPVRIQAMVADITDRQRTDKLLRESEARFRQIAENIRDVFWIVEDEKLVYISPAYEEIWGRRRDTLHEAPWFSDGMHPDDLAQMRHVVAEHRAGRTTAVEYRILHPDGSTRWVFDRGFPVVTDEGTVRRVVGTAEDITEKKRILEELACARDEAEQANCAKSAFLASLSHEIRTPLTSICGYSELLLSPNLSAEERATYVTTMRRNARMLAVLIDDILDLSKVEAGKMEVDQQQLSLPDLLADVMSTLSGTASEKGIALHVCSEGSVPEQITSDPLRLRQILLNIMGNAVKFTDKGRVDVCVAMKNCPKSGGKLEMTVHDTGIGISPEDSALLFQPFAQGRKDTSRLFGGTGLGLVLAKKLAQMLGGDVALSWSQPGKGSIFSISIDPAVAPEAPMMSNLDLKGGSIEEESAAGGGLPELNGVDVLVVEDAPDNQFLMKYILMASGAQVDLAASGSQAVEMAMHHEYDVILMDIQLPDFDGCEATTQLRRQGYDKPIVALTAYAMADDRIRSLKAGCNDHLSKPINSEALVHAVAQYAKQPLHGELHS